MSELQKKKISRAIEKVVNNNYKVVTDDEDEINDLLNESEFNWDELNSFRQEVGSKIIEFMTQITSVITKKEIVNNLGEEKDNFNKLVKIFFNDINSVSLKVKELVPLHENRTGKVVGIEEYDLFNKISLQYNAIFSELMVLTVGTIGEIILIANMAISAHKALTNENAGVISSEEVVNKEIQDVE